MKLKVLLCCFFFYAFAKAGTAQIPIVTQKDVAGSYTRNFNPNLSDENPVANATNGWSLTLLPDGHFEYHNFRHLKGQDEEHWYGKGIWTLKGKIVYFVTAPTDFNKKYNIDLNNSKARFFKKSARNKSNTKQPTYIQFFTSEYVVTKRLKLFKTND